MTHALPKWRGYQEGAYAVRPFHRDETTLSASAAAIYRELAQLGVHPARPEEIPEAREMAASLIGPGIVQSNFVSSVHERCGSAVFVSRIGDRLTGVLAVIPVNVSGLNALNNDRFNALAPEMSEVARRGEEPAAIYVWGMAAQLKMAGARLSSGLLAMGDRATPHLPYFARAATPAGAHLLRRTGFSDFAGSSSGLLRREPAQSRRAAA